jgi:hypothetical protein
MGATKWPSLSGLKVNKRVKFLLKSVENRVK